MWPEKSFLTEAMVPFDLEDLDNLKPYTSLQVVRYPRKKLNGLLETILEALPEILDEVLVDRLVTDVEVLLRARLGRPPWFRQVAGLLEFELQGDAASETDDFLEALGSRLRRDRSAPPVTHVGGRPAPTEPDLTTRICDLAGLEETAYRRRTLMTIRPPGVDDGLEVGAVGYLELRLPGWWAHHWSGPVDLLHQLVLVCRRRSAGKAGHYLAFYASEPAAKQRIARAIGSAEHPPPFCDLVRIDRQILDAAFVKRDRPIRDRDSQRRIRTLWLSGIHRSAAWKADGKILVGPDLENALEPLGDQTYFFTAARCLVPIARDRQPLTVGVAPQRSSLWAGSVPSWEAFRRRVVQLLDHIATSPRVKGSPLAVLAEQIQEKKPKVAGAYDMSLICPELLAEEPNLDPDVREQAELWAYRARFFDLRPKGEKGPGFTVEVVVDGAYVGALEIDFQRSGDIWAPKVKRLPYQPLEPRVLVKESIDLMVSDEAGEDRDRLESRRHGLHVEAAEASRRSRWLTVRYDSGYTLSGGRLFSVRHRDVVFDNWDWAELSEKGYNIWQEKPTVDGETGEPVLERPKERIKAVFDPTRIGKDRSLFCWVQKNWPIQTPGVASGWLACDDGAGEIADFIHLDTNPPDGRGPLLSLIHVKGSHSDSRDRQISTSDYEVVVGQAVKNLRFLDRINLADSLIEGEDKAVGQAVWKDGVRTTRSKMARVLRNLKENHRRRVVILQPRVTSKERRAVREDRGDGNGSKVTARVKRMRQLDTLLVGAQAECRALQADLLVVGESIG